MKLANLILNLFLFSGVAAQAQERPQHTAEELTRHAYRFYLNKPDTSIYLTQRALKMSLEQLDKFQEGYCYYLFAKTYWVKANYKLSLEYGFQALGIFEDLRREKELGFCQLALARTLVELGNFQKASEFIGRALDLCRARSMVRLEAAAYREHSFLHAELNQPDSALYYADKGASLFEALGDSLDISVLYNRKSRIYFQQRDFEASKSFAYQALRIDSLVNNRRNLGISYYQAAQNEHVSGDRQKAIALLKKSVRINSEVGNLNWQIRSQELLSKLYLEDGQPLLAAEALQQVSQYKDDLYNSEKNGQIQEMQSLHELEAKENTIQLLEQGFALKQQQVRTQRLFVAFLMVTVVFLVVLVFMLTRLRAIQTKTNRNLASKNFAIEQQKVAIQLQAENLRELDQVKTKLFSVISHDLRGPIANLQSLLDLFTKKLMTADEFITLSDKLKGNLNLTQRTLENLLNWSLSQMGGIKTDQRKVEVTEILEEATRLMEEGALKKNITFRKFFEDRINVWADADQLHVILRNLIHNAIKFSAFNSTIEISASRENDLCHIAVRDYGIGMTPDEIDALVGSSRYFSKTGTEQEKGTGLGLLLCKEFIHRNGGVISIKSSTGEGTEVSFTLSLAEPRPELAVNA